MKFELRSLKLEGAVGSWRLAVGGWQLAVGGWLLAVGGYLLDAEKLTPHGAASMIAGYLHSM